MDFNLVAAAKVQEDAPIDVIISFDGLGSVNFFGTHFWTSDLLVTWDMTTEERGAVDFGYHSCFGFDIC